MEETAEILAARRKWRYRGAGRPDFAETPGPGEESVWDYPRPPIMEAVRKTLTVQHDGETLARTNDAWRVLETAGAPTFYFPPADVTALIEPSGVRSICEWKGLAESLTIAGVDDAGWRYVDMFPGWEALRLRIAFCPAKLDCYIDAERVQPQPGGYYGGWVTADLSGPIKGESGSGWW